MTTGDIFSFHNAVIANDYVTVQTYLDNGGDIDAKSVDRNGYRALHWAAQEGHVDMVRLLLRNGANPNVSSNRSTERMTPLNICSARNQTGVARVLLEAGADPNIGNKYGWAPLHNASDYGYLEFMRILLDHGANIEARNERKCTPLHCAALKCNIPAVRMLLEEGADVNAVAKFGATPLWFASKFGARYGDSEQLERILREHRGISHPTRVALQGALLQGLRFLFLLAPLLAAPIFGVAIPGWGIALYILVVVIIFLVWGYRETVA